MLVVSGVAVVGLAGATEQDPTSGNSPPLTPTVYEPVLSWGAVKASYSTQASSEHALKTAIGICIISLAQILAAAQFVLEESIMSRYPIAPLQLVGYEGVAGLVVILSAQVIAHVTYGSTNGEQESLADMRTGWHQITHSNHSYLSRGARGWLGELQMVAAGWIYGACVWESAVS